MAIIIGRDAATSNLKISIGKQTILADVSNNVPKTVSREHCSIELQEDGKYLVKNLKVENTTYVNGLPYETKVVTENDRLELGPDRYAISWETIKKAIPTSEKSVDIRPLEKVWNKYNNDLKKQRIASQKFGNRRAAVGAITMGGMALGLVAGGSTPVSIACYVGAAILSIIFAVVGEKNSTKNPLKEEEIAVQFEKKYRCPECNRFLGYKNYRLLREDPCCPNCKIKFKS